MCVRVKGFEFHIGSHEVFAGGVYLSFIHGSRRLLSLEPELEQNATLFRVISWLNENSTWSQGTCILVPIEWKWFVLTLILTKIMRKQDRIDKFYFRISSTTEMNYIFRYFGKEKAHPTPNLPLKRTIQGSCSWLEKVRILYKVTLGMEEITRTR